MELMSQPYCVEKYSFDKILVVFSKEVGFK